jgi:hypothetical protein
LPAFWAVTIAMTPGALGATLTSIGLDPPLGDRRDPIT